jgi:hypothetical protein
MPEVIPGVKSSAEKAAEKNSQNDEDLDEDTIPTNFEDRCQFILKKIELDNIRDIEDPFVCLNVDLRKNKINKKP